MKQSYFVQNVLASAALYNPSNVEVHAQQNVIFLFGQNF